MSALPPKANIGTHSRNVRSVPDSDIARSKLHVCFTPQSGHYRAIVGASTNVGVLQQQRVQRRWAGLAFHQFDCMGLERVYSCWQYNPFLCGSRENVTTLTWTSTEPV